MENHPDVTVIISTYNQPDWLRLVLHSYETQLFENFEIILADDGSNRETQGVVEAFQQTSNLRITHLWQEDQGFRKTKILNKAIEKAAADYLIFTDGDCLAKNDFIRFHLSERAEKSALSGGYVKLTERVSRIITKEHILKQECFNKDWLLANGQPNSFKLLKLTRSKRMALFLNKITTTKATFDGMNVSCWKEDILAVKGFDERMEYGGEDREVGERMMYNGVKFKQIRYGSSGLHLYHERPYKTDRAELLNKKIRHETKKNKSTITNFGLK